ARDPVAGAPARPLARPHCRPGRRRRARAGARAARRSQGDLMAILVFIEQRDGKVRPVAREALGEAVRLAAALGGPVVGVCAAAADPGLAALGAAGATELLLATHETFQHYAASGYARAVVAAVEKVKPSVVLFSASAIGRDLAPRV